MPTTITIHAHDAIGVIRPELHGHFLEHLGTATYGGIWVGRDSTIPNIDGLRARAVEYLRTLAVPVLRWPGGCFADAYHWRDGIGPAERRPRTVNHTWGGSIEDNGFGTHEFMHLCSLIGAQPYLAANMGSGSPSELRDWVEYCNYPSGSTLADMRIGNGARDPFAVRYWGIGNESWACGGNMTAEEYAALYARFGTFVPTCGGTTPYLIAVGPNNNDTAWTRRFFTALSAGRMFTPRIHGFAMHYYSWGTCAPTRYTPDALRTQFSSFEGMEHAIVEQRAYLDMFAERAGIPRIDLLVDEWGTWDVSEKEVEDQYGLFWQQNTIRDAAAAALGLNVFHRHADKLGMCNIAQVANVLQASLLTSGPACVRTPTYHALVLMKDHRNRTALRVESPLSPSRELSVSASRDDRTIVVTCVNPDPGAPRAIRLDIGDASISAVEGEEIADNDPNACNTFANPDRIVPHPVTPEVSGDTIAMTMAPLSIMHLRITVS
ncbi:MAG: alpha-N-arabinofuranosidase [Ignavibacteriae bacterium]|nr:alpha-N-arabinofuranosidase [Ignavibacteriota bacterium]